MAAPRTLLEKIWESHLVDQQEDGTCLLYIDRHIIHEVTSPQPFEGLKMAGRQVRRPELTLAVIDHNIATDRDEEIPEDSQLQIDTLRRNCADFGVELFEVDDPRNGIVHIIGPEQGFTLPGTTLVCGDSHTATHGALGSLAFGIGTSEVEHVMASQTLLQAPVKSMRVTVNGELSAACTAKDLILALIGKIGTGGGTGHVIEYTGPAISALSMEGRMTVSNMSIEAGARAGLIAPDEKTFEYLTGRPFAPKGADWDAAVAYWKTLPSDPGATYDTEVTLDVGEIEPQVTWGTSPEDVISITGVVPDPKDASNEDKAAAIKRSNEYMGLQPGTKMTDIEIDTVFVGACTNGRIEDIRAVAEVAKGRKVKGGIRTLIVPGSGLVKQQAEEEGLAQILMDAGFDWREPGCS
ncbi:MAG: 3-isopropylmalate dehydratase large subunit, partial [Pseudomonadota bacterium]|nr:3-isopropylmalate dehydratase large subunit [Pseudomonadota bacterium]